MRSLPTFESLNFVLQRYPWNASTSNEDDVSLYVLSSFFSCYICLVKWNYIDVFDVMELCGTLSAKM